jgi:hypothetical protein
MRRFPWWGSVLLAILSYFGLKHGSLQIIAADSALADLLPLFAPLASMGFLLLAGKQLYDTEHKEQNTPETEDVLPKEDKKNIDIQ